LHDEIILEIADDLLPKRRLRVNPRVVKKKISGFALKRHNHSHFPQPMEKIIDAVRIIK
jgi:hypothetical protein